MFKFDGKVKAFMLAAALCFAGGFVTALHAQESEAPREDIAPPVLPAMPVLDVPVVAELFTSQACVFCPEADRLFGLLAAQPGVIALACHIDYFDVRRGSLSKPFCTRRQTRYSQTLEAGPVYTPQMVVQGRYDALGYRTEDVGEALHKAAALKTLALRIAAGEAADSYRVALDDGARLPRGAFDAWLAVYDHPHELTIAGGSNRGQQMTYYNVVSHLENIGRWKGPVTVRVTPGGAQKGFAVLLQDTKDGVIRAAGQYAFGQDAVPGGE